MHGNFSYWEGVCLLSGAEAERQWVVQPAAGNTLDRQNPGASDSLRAAIQCQETAETCGPLRHDRDDRHVWVHHGFKSPSSTTITLATATLVVNILKISLIMSVTRLTAQVGLETTANKLPLASSRIQMIKPQQSQVVVAAARARLWPAVCPSKSCVTVCSHWQADKYRDLLASTYLCVATSSSRPTENA